MRNWQEERAKAQSCIDRMAEYNGRAIRDEEDERMAFARAIVEAIDLIAELERQLKQMTETAQHYESNYNKLLTAKGMQ